MLADRLMVAEVPVFTFEWSGIEGAILLSTGKPHIDAGAFLQGTTPTESAGRRAKFPREWDRSPVDPAILFVVVIA